MAMFLASTSVGNGIVALVNWGMERPLNATTVEVGAETWVGLDDVRNLVVGQKVDFAGSNGISVTTADPNTGAPQTDKLSGTYLVAETDAAHHRIRIMDYVERKPVVTSGAFDASNAKVSTYKLVGPQYFLFFSAVCAAVGVLFIFFAMRYKEKTHLRDEAKTA
jgi:POT family proton-dependent oligopeptide transporter